MKQFIFLTLSVLLLVSFYPKGNEYKNLVFNPKDTQAFNGIYPHAFSNSETRGEKAFLA